MSVLLRRGSSCPLSRSWIAAYRDAVPLAHANQLSLPRLQSAAVNESSHVSSAISSIQSFTFTFTNYRNSSTSRNVRRAWNTMSTVMLLLQRKWPYGPFAKCQIIFDFS